MSWTTKNKEVSSENYLAFDDSPFDDQGTVKHGIINSPLKGSIRLSTAR